jgi:peptidoglycan/LPS O-acetylase OafA/YrhL
MRTVLRRLASLSLLANRYPALHGLRVLAIVAVVQIHVTKTLVGAGVAPSPWLADASKRVYFGMDLFFVLSGFLIGAALLHAMESERSVGAFGRFYVRRALRTFPLYYAVLAALVLLTSPSEAQRASLPAEFLYVSNYGAYGHARRIMPWAWSLCVEEHFYLLAPLLLLLLSRLETHRARLSLLGGLWLAGLGVRLAVILGHGGPWARGELLSTVYVQSHTRFDLLVAGIALAYLQRHFAPRLRALAARPAVRAACLALSALAFAALAVPAMGIAGRQISAAFTWGTISSVAYAPLILLALNTAGPSVRLLGRPIFLRAATLGYGVYLVHLPVLKALVVPAARAAARAGLDADLTWVLGLGGGLALSFAVAYALHLIVEKPVLALRDRVAPGAVTPGAAAGLRAASFGPASPASMRGAAI